MFPNTYDSVADRSGEYFRELANYSTVAVRIQGKAKVNSRQGQPFHVVSYRRFTAYPHLITIALVAVVFIN